MLYRFCCILLLFLAFLNISIANTQDSKYIKQDPKKSYLFVISGADSLLEVNDPYAGQYTLTFSAQDKSILWFTDRPYREEGTMKWKTFINDWSSDKYNFLEVPPNTVLEGETFDGKRVEYVFEMYSPRLSDDKQSLIFNVQGLALKDTPSTCLQSVLPNETCLKTDLQLSDSVLFFEN